MKIFENKPLCMILCILLGGFSLFSFQGALIPLFVFSSLLILLLLFLWNEYRRSKPLILAICALGALILAFALSFLYFRVWFPAANRFTDETEMEGTVTELYYAESYGASFVIKTKDIGGKPFTRYKLVVECDTAACADIEIGDTLRLKATLSSLSDTNDALWSYYRSDGYSALATITSDSVEVTGHQNPWLHSLLVSWRNSIHAYLTSLLGEDAGGLLLALLIDDRSALSPKCKLDFTRIGVSHLLALSGQHLSILAFMIHTVLSFFYVDKRIRVSALSVFVLLYVFLAGFSPSVMRAGIMVIITSVYFLLAKPHDTLTVLAATVFLMVLVHPYQITDVSLLLSALATYGIVICVERLPKKRSGLLYTLLSPLVLSVIFSVAALFFTSTLSIFTFREISLLSIPSTLILSFFVEIYIILGIPILLIGWLIPMRWLASFLYQAITSIAAFFSNADYATVSTAFTAVEVLSVIFLVLLILFLVLHIRHKRIALFFLFSLFVSVYLTAYIQTTEVRKNDDVVYFSDEERSESFLLKDNGLCTYIDLSVQRNSMVYKTLDTLAEEHITYLDCYVLPSLSQNSADLVSSIFARIRIDKLYIPKAISESEQLLIDRIRSAVSAYGVDIITYSSESFISTGEIKTYFVERAPYEEGAKMIFTIEYQNALHTYFSRGVIDSENEITASELMAASRTVILGHRGRVYSPPYQFQRHYDGIELLILSDETITIPTETFSYYMEFCEILYRPKRCSLIR